MYALFIVLNDVNQLDEILERFVKVGVKGATVLDSQGMGGAMVHGAGRSLPLFGSLRSLMDSARPYNKTIFSVLESEEMVERQLEQFRMSLTTGGRRSWFYVLCAHRQDLQHVP